MSSERWGISGHASRSAGSQGSGDAGDPRPHRRRNRIRYHKIALEVPGAGVFAVAPGKGSYTRIRLWATPASTECPRGGTILPTGAPGEPTCTHPGRGLTLHHHYVVNTGPDNRGHENPTGRPVISWQREGQAGDIIMYDSREDFNRSVGSIVVMETDEEKVTMIEACTPEQMDDLWQRYRRARATLGVPFPVDQEERGW